MRLRLGDKVQIKPLEELKHTKIAFISSGMGQYCGQIVTISELSQTYSGTKYILIKEDRLGYAFSYDTFVPLAVDFTELRALL